MELAVASHGRTLMVNAEQWVCVVEEIGGRDSDGTLRCDVH